MQNSTTIEWKTNQNKFPVAVKQDFNNYTIDISQS